MERLNAKQLSEILKKFSEGKIIQGKYIGNWIDINDDAIEEWIFKIPIRIKPEPKLVPFTFGDNNLFKDKWVVYNEDGSMCKIIGFDECNVYFRARECSYEKFMQGFTFEDGEPCGKYID